MKDVRDNAFSFLDDWYGRLDDIIEDLKNNGFTVLNATNEFIDVSDENDKEYVLKLGGTEKTITINKIEALDESLIPIQEYYDEDEWDDDELASIYDGDTKDSRKAIADEMNESTLNEASNPRDDLESKINKFALSLNRMSNYELSRYNKNKLRELALAIINYRNNYDSKAYQLYIDMINRNSKSWGTPTYDEYRTKYANKLGMNESVYDGDTANWNKISIGDVARWTTKGMGRLPKVGDSFRVGPFIGKCTKISGSKVYMKVESNARESDVNESSGHPKLGKKIKQLKGWKIYQGTDQFGETVFRCFTPDDDYPTVGYEDWECETLDQAISWIENYDLKESKKPVNESNKELARIAFEDILKPFNGTDIKYTDETEDAEFKTHSYVANIISTPQYVELIKKLIDSDKYEYDPDFNDYVKYTEYGQITIIIEDKYITIEVMYNNDEDYFDENLILIKEKNNDEKVIYKDNINIDMNVVITEDPNNSEYYNIYVDDDPTLFLQEPKSAVKKLKLTALDAVIDYYKAEHFSDTDY